VRRLVTLGLLGDPDMPLFDRYAGQLTNAGRAVIA
jgi:hypothetical protein